MKEGFRCEVLIIVIIVSIDEWFLSRLDVDIKDDWFYFVEIGLELDVMLVEFVEKFVKKLCVWKVKVFKWMWKVYIIIYKVDDFVSIIFGFEFIFIEWDWLFFILVFGLFGDCLLVLIVVVVVEILCLGFFFGW